MPETLPVYIAPFDLFLFGKGEHWDLYRILGAHFDVQDKQEGYRFAVWAPNARNIYVAGDFNNWDSRANQLYPVGVSGIWAGFVPDVVPGQMYKYQVVQSDGREVTKTDPFAFRSEMRPGHAAVTWGLENYEWTDDSWMTKRRNDGLPLDKPMSCYEVHLGSWRRDNWDYRTYRQLTEELIPYVKDMGFTHIELMPIAEHPLDESWGYQTSHYFSPTSRHGTPDDLRYFIDKCHQEGIGVILDWVPGHFPKDEWGLGRFDGTALYEHADPRKGEHPDWGTYIFNFGRHEVCNFLLTNALYWLKEFHIDGLRIDAVASMLYLDYSRKDGEWVANEHGGNENIEAIQLFKQLNTVVHDQFPGAMMIAEESTSWPGVSRPVYTGGLGFTFKWNMGWMNDTLDYVSKSPIHRAYHHNSLTFSMIYAFSENFVLPLSHDEVVHGKGALLSKMPGDTWQQMANLRLLFSYQWAHPGKKLLFMGCEFGQWNEWDCRKELDWLLLGFPAHQGIRNTVTDLNRTMRENPAMYKQDNDWSGFEWVDFSDFKSSTISFLRKNDGDRPILWIFNFTPVVRSGYCLGCPQGGRWKEIFNSDAEIYGGSNVGNVGEVVAKKAGDIGSFPYYLELTLPPLGAIALRPE
ncbi:1,4-alpha-glucan branching protein GlgB [Maridesulfovibrio ferrireducens]|uniref:1,4-alpha-glucan branching protein GlgB n=1 Tax=Maridesulfovibrio ferrireducens TaxID=246191 RepID=UPI001A1B5A64|nr:1,4-alpha-glucan branching protein GlgB [Maridesulfovibrio ferrireducens]MBI9112157.1 1,4-alpha-glucan branching protein GlgB [Maridesulfovibrio ferrireducens]